MMYSSQAIWALVVAVGVILPLAYGEVVLDIAEQPLEAGTQYHILPINGGGLGLKMRVNNSCPMFVNYNKKEQGLPVVFTPYKSAKAIAGAADFKVQVSAATVCGQSTRWRMISDSKLDKYFVYAGDSASSSSSTTDLDYFRILESEIYGNVYVLSFCPSVCENCRPVCGLLGTYTDKDSNQWLVIDRYNNPLKVQFKRA